MTAYDDLIAFDRETQALAQIAGRLGWDQETMMPRGSADQRGEEFAAIEGVLHARRTDPRVGEWLATADAKDEVATAMLRQIRRSYDRAMKVPAKLAAEIAKVTSKSQGIWAEARSNNDFAAFTPTFKEVLRLKREEGAALANSGDIYDAMLDDYEPGAKAADLVAMFDAMRPRLV
ncbi:MAG: carboxypeptidase M32, partial [Marivivens sp.]|nr:carboxypeptidase M32 [Marivivens sp.]